MPQTARSTVLYMPPYQKRTAAVHELNATAGRLRVDLFERLMDRRGATTWIARAVAAEVGRTTMFRLRRGEGANLTTALKLAKAAGTTVDKLFERVEAA